MSYNRINYIDTIQLRDSVFFKDGGIHIDLYSYATNKETTGTEWKYDYIKDGETSTAEKINRQTSLYGARLYKTPKEFVNWYGFHLQIKAPPSLMKQQHSNHKVLSPIKCYLTITIPSIIELKKSDVWDKWFVAYGSNVESDDISNYILSCIDISALEIMKWGNWTHNEIKEMINKDRSSVGKNYLSPKDMELAQVDFCVNTIDSDVSHFYNLLQYAGNYGRKNMKLYHNNIDSFDAEYTIGNYNNNKELVVKTPGSISTKANGLEFRRGSKSSQVVKFYDYTQKSLKYQVRNYLPIYSSRNNKEAIDRLQRYYGKSPKEMNERKTTMRYECSFRNIVGGNKGVYNLFKKYFPTMETKLITIKELFDKRYSRIIGKVMRGYLYDIFGDAITNECKDIGDKHMNKFDILKTEGFSKGLQIMAILQLMDGDNGLTIGEVKQKFLEAGVSYEQVRRLLNKVKDEGYASKWSVDRVVAMNVIKELYSELDKVK